MSSEPLKFPPLQEVAFEVNFSPHLRVEDRIADFQDEIKDQFPDYNAEVVLRLPAGIYTTSRRREEHPVQPVKTHAFLSVNGRRAVKVSTVNLNLIVQDYLHFDDYLKSASRCLNVAFDKFQIREIYRVGLRYINSIKVEPLNGRFNVAKYVRPVLSQDLQSKADTFLAETTEAYADRKLTARSGLLGIEDSSEYGKYVIDLDCFSEKKQVIEQIDKILLNFHDLIEKRFHESVTDRYLHYMRTGEW